MLSNRNLHPQMTDCFEPGCNNMEQAFNGAVHRQDNVPTGEVFSEATTTGGIPSTLR